MKNEKGSITLFVLIAMIFFLGIAMTAYVSASNKIQGQSRELAQIKASYGQDLSEEGLANLYESLLPKYTIKFDNNYLPSEYQEVEYIESSGEQYIDSGIAFPEGVHAKFKFSYNSLSTTGEDKYDVMFGSEIRPDNTYIASYFGRYNDNLFAHIWGETLTGPAVTTNSDYIVDYSSISENKFLKINNTVYGTSTNTIQNNNALNMYIFAMQSSNNNAINFSNAKLYYLKMYTSVDETKIVRDFIPCYKEQGQNATTGLYDRAEGKFYPNEGQGQLGKGADVTVITGEMENQRYLLGEAQNLSENKFERTGYRFLGWNTNRDGSGTTYSDKQRIRFATKSNVDELTLYAQWEEE